VTTTTCFGPVAFINLRASAVADWWQARMEQPARVDFESSGFDSKEGSVWGAGPSSIHAVSAVNAFVALTLFSYPFLLHFAGFSMGYPVFSLANPHFPRTFPRILLCPTAGPQSSANCMNLLPFFCIIGGKPMATYPIGVLEL
jgi:hypothetical protein